MGIDRFITFAYGSNMPTARITARCPSARVLGIAELRGHELRWHKISIDGSGKCDIVPSVAPNASVFGVLYEIAAGEKAALDRAESKGSGYEEIAVDVVSDGKPLKAKAYRATKTDSARRPYTWYRALVLAGAREHGLPTSYVSQLEAVSADADADKAREHANLELIAEVQP